jgi:histidine triad (HIT) family protein
MSSIFTKIVRGEIPCYKIAETDDYLAFLDIRPMAKGHTLCIPKQEIDYIFELPDDIYVGLQLFAREVAKGLRLAIPCSRIGVAVIGDEVPHAHIHLIPFNRLSDMEFRKKPLSFTPEEMTAIAAEIRAQIG